MRSVPLGLRSAALVPLLALLACGPKPSSPSPSTASANPCAAKNVCKPTTAAANPCAAKNVCKPATAAANPCAGSSGGMAMAPIDSNLIRQRGRRLFTAARHEELVASGRELWNDAKLSQSGTLSCATCHQGNYGMMQASFAQPYPHRVEMAQQRTGVSEVNAAEMVQFCMVAPMANKPLPWGSRELAALTAYVESIRGGYKPSTKPGANPCASPKANPCRPQ